MADLDGYTGIPDTLPEAQATIVRLLEQIKRNVRQAACSQRVREMAIEGAMEKLEAQKS